MLSTCAKGRTLWKLAFIPKDWDDTKVIVIAHMVEAYYYYRPRGQWKHTGSYIWAEVKVLEDATTSANYHFKDNYWYEWSILQIYTCFVKYLKRFI